MQPISSQKESTVFVLIALYILGHETFMLYNQILFWYVVKLIVPFALLMCLLNFRTFSVRKVRLSNECKTIMYVYLIFIIYGHLVNLFSEDIADGMITGYKIFMKFLFFFVVGFVLHSFAFSDRLIKFPMYIGLFFAVQSIILIVRLWSGFPPETKEVLFQREAFIGDDPWISYGIWGYGNWMQQYSSGDGMGLMIRAQSFFSEASNLGKFLLYPTFVSWGLYILTKKKWYFVIALSCFLGMITTLSLTVAVAFSVTLFLYLVERNRTGLKKIAVGVVGIAVLVFIASLAWNYFLEIYNPDRSSATLVEAMLGRRDVSVTYRLGWTASVIELVKEHPLGIGFVSQLNSRYLDPNDPSAIGQNPFAPASWLLKTGPLGLGMMVFILVFVYMRVLRKQILQSGNISRYVALGFISQILVHVGHGNWIDPMFMFTLALVLYLDRKQIQVTGSRQSNLFVKNNPVSCVMVK